MVLFEHGYVDKFARLINKKLPNGYPIYNILTIVYVYKLYKNKQW